MSMILTIRHLSGSLAGKSQRIAMQEGQALRLGRAPESDIKFSDTADDSVSGHHAELSLQGGRLSIEDKRSANGTFVNGAPVPPFQKVAVPDGSRLRLGRQGPELQITLEQAPAAVAAGPAATATGAAATAVTPPKEAVGRSTMLREIDRARQEERDAMLGEVAKSKKSTGLWVGVGLVLVLLLAGGGIGAAYWWNQRQAGIEKAALEARLAEQQAAMAKEKTLWADVEKQVGRAVVHIRCIYRIRVPRSSLVAPRGEFIAHTTGSGVQIRPGLVLTARHVVEPWRVIIKNWTEWEEQSSAKAEYDTLQVQFPGQQPINATLVASSDLQDLALLQIQPTSAPAVGIVGSNAAVNVTDRIAVVGYPAELGQRPILIRNLAGFGEEWARVTEVTPTFVVGTVSQPLTGASGADYVLFDASVTHGNSGGALVNDRGELIGIVSQQFTTAKPGEILGVPVFFQEPVAAGNMAVSPDHILRFLRERGIG